MNRIRPTPASVLNPAPIVIALWLIFFAARLQAATFFIANGDVTGLKDAIRTANRNHESDVINLATNGFYILTTLDNIGTDRNGIPVIEDDAATGIDLTIDGHGSRIQRSTNPSTPKFRIFQISSAASCILENMTLDNGNLVKASAGETLGGAALYNAGTTTCYNCAFYSNVVEGWSAPAVSQGFAAYGGYAQGGAICNVGTLRLTSCILNNNIALGGKGGDSTDPNGEAGWGGYALGGAIYSDGVELALSQCSFLNNSGRGGRGGNGRAHGGNGVAGFGGAIYDSNGPASLTGCTFQQNYNSVGIGGTGDPGTPDGLDGYQTGGGAVMCHDATVTDCVFDRNTSFAGGAINLIEGALVVSGSQFFGNIATRGDVQDFGPLGGGGAIYYHKARPNNELDSLSLKLCTFQENTSDGYGGALNVPTSASIAVTIDSCLFDSNTAARDGGAFAGQGAAASIAVTNTTFLANHASGGGGAYIGGSAQLSVTNSTFSGNTANDEFAGSGVGGGLYNDGANLTVANSTFFGNNAGLAKSIANRSALTLRNTLFKKASSGDNLVNDSGNGATVTSLGGNICDDAAGGTSGTAPGGLLNGPGDLRNTDPKLDVLANSGGPTDTHALLAGSPAINHGQGSLPDRDQRSYLRTGVIDSGAFEFSGSLAPVTAGSIRTQSGTSYGVDFPLTGTPGVECRSGGANGNYTMSLYFGTPVTVSSASVTSGVGMTNGVLVNGSYVTVLLTNVANAQQIVVTLNNVSDGTHTNNVNIPARFLLGDTNGDGTVNSADIAQTKSKSGQTVSSANFRNDVNADGAINSADISLVKSKSGTAIP